MTRVTDDNIDAFLAGGGDAWCAPKDSKKSDPKLGKGRFWVIDVEYLNQRDELVGVESYTGFGYKREAS